MIDTEDRLASALESAVEDLEFILDAASLEFEVMTSPNTNQYIIAYADGERHAHVTVESIGYGIPAVFVDIYSVDADGGERWVHGGLSCDEAVDYIVNA